VVGEGESEPVRVRPSWYEDGAICRWSTKPTHIKMIIFIHTAVNGYLTLLRAGEGEGGEEEEW